MITADELDRLRSLFEALRWPMAGSDGDTSELLTSFVQLLSELDTEGRALLLAITQDFLRHTLDLYDRSTVELVDKLSATVLPPNATVVLLPLINPNDAGEIKSHGMASYLVKKELLGRASDHGWVIRDWDRADRMAQDFPHRRNAYVLLVDDFIGTGETAEAAWKDFSMNYAVPSDNVCVACFVAQRAGIEHMKHAGIACVNVHERWKGITDSSHLVDKPVAMGIMDSIESNLEIEPNKRRGYQQSEALVMMHSCPDNTFPVYWARKMKSGRMWPRPFRRYE